MQTASQTEQEAIAAMQRDIQEIRNKAFMQLKYLVRGDIGLAVCGYKDLGDAARRIIGDAMKKIDAREKEFLRKFPD